MLNLRVLLTAPFLLSFTCLIILLNSINGQAMERRRDQFSNEPGYLLAPVPYRIPGIGSGIAGLGLASNIFETHIDLLGTIITGDAEGYGYGLLDLHIIPEILILDYSKQHINLASMNMYGTRGMDTDPDDYKIVEVKDNYFEVGRAILTFFDRMLEIYGYQYQYHRKISALRDPSGELILKVEDPEEDVFEVSTAGVLIDYTDDYLDPRKGVRLDVNYSYSPPIEDSDPDYYVVDENLLLYLPIGDISTWSFNYYRSDAYVTTKGETDRAVIAQQNGLNCDGIQDPAGRSECQASADIVIDNIIAANQNGTATSLGGRNRLRSFAQMRFKGAHMEFYGTEFRWNITDEFSPFNVWFMKDVRTNVQLALFHELGSVAEERDKLGTEFLSSTGVGLRLLTGSGRVFRLDYAVGKEGGQLTAIINYPWESY